MVAQCSLFCLCVFRRSSDRHTTVLVFCCRRAGWFRVFFTGSDHNPNPNPNPGPKALIGTNAAFWNGMVQVLTAQQFSITDQLSCLGVRGLELDLHYSESRDATTTTLAAAENPTSCTAQMHPLTCSHIPVFRSVQGMCVLGWVGLTPLLFAASNEALFAACGTNQSEPSRVPSLGEQCSLSHPRTNEVMVRFSRPC